MLTSFLLTLSLIALDVEDDPCAKAARDFFAGGTFFAGASPKTSSALFTSSYFLREPDDDRDNVA
jgi:hypothetical protein